VSRLDRARDQAIECACAGEEPRPLTENDCATDVTRARPFRRALGQPHALLLKGVIAETGCDRPRVAWVCRANRLRPEGRADCPRTNKECLAHCEVLSD